MQQLDSSQGKNAAKGSFVLLLFLGMMQFNTKSLNSLEVFWTCARGTWGRGLVALVVLGCWLGLT